MSESLRCLILAPTGGDAGLIAETLEGENLSVHICRDLSNLCGEIPAGAGVVVVAEEAIDVAALAEIRSTLDESPIWSLLPFVLLTSADLSGDADVDVAHLFGTRGSVTLVERPCRTATLASAVRSALYARQRQYEVRSLLERLDVQARELTQSNTELYRFAAAASHDLQEPLRMIISYLALIEKRNSDRLDQKSREHFHFVTDAAARMNTLIRSLLEYARLGETPLHLSIFPAEEALGEALHHLSIAIEEAKPAIAVTELPTIQADRTLITQLFQNLIGNAIKYRQAEPRIGISASETEQEWIFSISDNGIGITADNLGRIFTAFQRLHSRESYAGHGIGLATCRRITDLHRGRIWVESTLGVGSTFSFALPKHPPVPSPAS